MTRSPARVGTTNARQLGSFSEQFPLLFCDHLRAHPPAASEYADVERRPAAQFRHDRPAYVGAKGSIVWKVIRHADAWAQHIGGGQGGFGLASCPHAGCQRASYRADGVL
ncbi:GrpB family protein [Micromonospora sp. DT63]|uniref:GrpB family protein n=1 Tax=Micromonospora sp. DT63 TaxID=3393441 RepID=UPI003CFA4218